MELPGIQSACLKDMQTIPILGTIHCHCMSDKHIGNCLQAASMQFSYAMGGQDWPGECGNGLTQSPINIVPGRHPLCSMQHCTAPYLHAAWLHTSNLAWLI